MNHKKHSISIWGASFLVAEGLKSLYHKEGRFMVTETTGTYAQLLRALIKNPPDVLVLDTAALLLEDADLKELRKLPQPPALLLISDSVNRNEFQLYSEAGIENIVLKNSSGSEILNATESAIYNRKYYSSEILDMILESIVAKQQINTESLLTSTERDIIRQIAGGLTTKEIASVRNVSFHTVNTHRKNIFRKLKVNNASEMIMKAVKAGWIDDIEYYI